MHAPLKAHGAGAAMLRKLKLRSPLDPDEREVLMALPVGETSVAQRTAIVHEGERLARSCLLIDGLACRYKLLPDGSRQIVSLHLPGDVIDLQSAVLKVADHGIAALSHVRVAYLPHAALLDAAARHRGIGWAFWRETTVEGAIDREWLLNIGRRDAFGRLAHLLCEIALRMEAIGLCHGNRFQFPVTQSELADVAAMTPVHVNRTLQRLRAEGLIGTRGTEVHVLDWDRLVEAGSFDPAYLYLPPAGAASEASRKAP